MTEIHQLKYPWVFWYLHRYNIINSGLLEAKQLTTSRKSRKYALFLPYKTSGLCMDFSSDPLS